MLFNMPKKRKKNKRSNLKIGIIFSAVIVFLVAVSLLSKLIFLFGQSRYDDNYPFYLKVDSGNSVQFIVVFSKQHKINILNFKNSSAFYFIPHDGEISKSPTLAQPDSVSSFFLPLLKEKSIKTNLTAIDEGRLYLFSKTVSKDDITNQTIASPREDSDKIISQAFSDPAIVSEDLRVEVVNATGVYGVGNNVAKFLSDIGANVVFVSTADNIQKQSLIYYTGGKSYTVGRLSKLLGFKASRNDKKTISDVIIQIGQDSQKLAD